MGGQDYGDCTFFHVFAPPIFSNGIYKYPNLIVVSNQSSTFNKVLNKVKRNHNLFLVDPNGNVILGYNENFEGKKLLKDIKKLLKLSKIG